MLNFLLRHPLAVGIITIVAGGACLAPAAEPTSFRNPGITNPSEQRGLNFNVPGVVSKVLVKEGDFVKKGSVIAQQDDSVDLAELKAKQAEAASSALQIDAANTDLAQKRVELARDEEMFKKKVLGQSDLDKAKLDVDIGVIRVKLAEQETKQKNDEVETQQAKIEQKKLVATIDGIVQKINVHEGELATNDPKTPCIQIVQNEPLFVEIDIPVDAAKSLQVGQHLDVTYDTKDSNKKWLDATISFLNPVANAAAGMQRVRLELANPDHLRSGLQVEVAPQSPSHNKGVAAAIPAR